MAGELEHSSKTFDDGRKPFDEEGFSRRIDDLVEDALRQQSAEQRALTEALEGARSELATLRELVERRDMAVTDALEARFSGIATQDEVERLSNELREMARMGESTDVAEVLAPVLGQLDSMTARIDSLDQALESVREAVERVDPWKPALEVQRTLRETLALAIRSIEERASEAERSYVDRVEQVVSSFETKLDSMEVDEAIRSAAGELREAIQSAGARTFDRLVQLQADTERMGSAIQAAADRHSEEMRDSLERTNTELRSSLGETAQGLHADLNDLVTKAADSIEEGIKRQTDDDQARSAAISRQMEAVRKSIESQSHEVTAAVENSIDPFAEQLRRFASLLTQANRRITESNARMEALQESLVAYLATRDEQVEEERSRAIEQVIGGVSESLKRRDRLRIGDALKKSEQQRKDRRDAERYRKLKKSGGVSSEADSENLAATLSPPPQSSPRRDEPVPTSQSKGERQAKPVKPKRKTASRTRTGQSGQRREPRGRDI